VSLRASPGALEKKSLSPVRNWTFIPHPPACSLVTIPSELSCLPQCCVLYVKVNVLSLPCHRAETACRGAKQWQVTYFTVKIWYNFVPPLTIIRRTHWILSNLHLMNAPNHWPFKCPVHSCRGVELWPHTLSPHYIMVCGQIQAPATLRNYVCMYLMNSKFLASL
jgi:hypothetical protein